MYVIEPLRELNWFKLYNYDQSVGVVKIDINFLIDNKTVEADY